MSTTLNLYGADLVDALTRMAALTDKAGPSDLYNVKLFWDGVLLRAAATDRFVLGVTALAVGDVADATPAVVHVKVSDVPTVKAAVAAAGRRVVVTLRFLDNGTLSLSKADASDPFLTITGGNSLPKLGRVFDTATTPAAPVPVFGVGTDKMAKALKAFPAKLREGVRVWQSGAGQPLWMATNVPEPDTIVAIMPLRLHDQDGGNVGHLVGGVDQ